MTNRMLSLKKQVGPLSCDCLRLMALHGEGKDWEELYRAICDRWSAKAVDRKLLGLSRRGYIDYGVSPRTGWLTDKGREALK